MAKTYLDDALHVRGDIPALSIVGVAGVRVGARMDLLIARSKDALQARLRTFGQEHLLAFWDRLEPEGQGRLADAIAVLDLETIQRHCAGAEAAVDWSRLARRASPPRAIRLRGSGNGISAAQAREAGEAALRAGRVGFILVAGGEGTRLGFSRPKGLFPIGPVSGRSLIQVLADRLRAVAKRYACRIPLYLMTSPSTHDDMMAYLANHSYLGLAREDVRVFCQGTLPAVDCQTGKILMTSPDTMAMTPDGHGGMLTAFHSSGNLAEARGRGIEIFFYGQVDNPLLTICDPEFLGYHVVSQSVMTTQVVEKKHALERVGNVVEIDGQARIIEYIDLPREAAEARDAEGSLVLWAGNTAVHAFDAVFLERAATSAEALPVHRALKKVGHIDAKGEWVCPSQPNAWKLERFIFDLLPFARRTLVVEVDARQAFAPLKNASGEASDTPETARAAMIQHDVELLRRARVVVGDDVAVEVNPLWALDAREVTTKVPAGFQITGATYFV